MNNIGFLDSIRYVAVGWRLMRTKGLRRFVWMPLLVNFLIFGVLGWWLYGWAIDGMSSWSTLSRWSDWWIISVFVSLIQWLISFVLFFIMAILFTLLANLFGAPFNGLLAERVEAYLVGTTSQSAPSWLTLVKSVPRLMGSELAKLGYLLVCLIPLLLLQFVPIINIIAPALLFLFAAWMFTLEYMDYPMGNHGALFKDVRHRMRSNRKSAYGFGCAIAFLSAIPIVNLFIMPIAVAGATALYVDHFRDDHLSEAKTQ